MKVFDDSYRVDALGGVNQDMVYGCNRKSHSVWQIEQWDGVMLAELL